MKKIFEKWWSKGTKCFSIRNYRKAWKAVGNNPRVDFWTNKAKKGRDKCLDVHLIIGYTIFNYTNFDYSSQKKHTV